MADMQNSAFASTKVYPLDSAHSAQSTAYALAEFLDVKKNMITQTMRTKEGYLVQCKGDATAEWTKYIGADAAVSVSLEEDKDVRRLKVTVGADKWLNKAGMMAMGIFFSPLLFTTTFGALRQASLYSDIFNFISDYLGSEPIETYHSDSFEEAVRPQPDEEPGPDTIICPYCGAENKAGAKFCRSCGASLEKKEIRCESCGAVLDGDETYCPYCGHKLK